MKHNVLAPSVGESITEVSILKWVKKDGQAVKAGDLLLEIESDKATVEIVAESSGQLSILKQDGERIPVGEIIGAIDDSATGSAEAPAATAQAPTAATQAPAAIATPAIQADATAAAAAPASTAAATSVAAPATPSSGAATSTSEGMTPGPAARKALAEKGLEANQVTGTGKEGRVTKGDVASFTPGSSPSSPSSSSSASHPSGGVGPSQAQAVRPPGSSTQAAAPIPLREGDRRVPMSNLRAKIAERLVYAQHTAAILTTFNEVDMSPVMKLRNQHKDAFKAKHGVGLSFMSFFTRASIESLKMIPEVNASIDGRDMIYHDYFDIGIAVGTERGLVVPVVRDAGKMGFVEIEKKITELAIKARDGKLSIADMSGGTFTISNGGTYGSLLSTPILNPPQSGILGMHKIQERPVAIEGKVEIRPMMYLALSYDHRIIDGKGAVTFLVNLKDFLEHPEKLGLEF